MSSIVSQFKDMMANFESGQLLGVDIGLSAIKVCRLSAKGKKSFRVEDFGHIPLPEASIIEDEIEKPEEIIALLSDLLKENGITTRISCLGLDGPNTFTKRLTVPDGSKEDVEDNVLWEAEQYIPFSADESELDYVIIQTNADEDVKDVLVASVKNSVVEKYSYVLGECGLKVRVVDLKVLSLVNLFETIFHKKLDDYSEQGAVLIDFGAQTTKVLVYKNFGPVLTKEIPLGGVLITEEIQRTMGVSYQEAEDLKVNGDAKGNLPEEILQIIQNKSDEVLNEIKKILNFYIAAGSSETVTHCFVTGGGSNTPGLIDKLTDILGIQVRSLNPLEQISCSKKIKGKKLDYLNTCGAVAMGLSLRKV